MAPRLNRLALGTAAAVLLGGALGWALPASGAPAAAAPARPALGSLSAAGISVLDVRLGQHPDRTRFVLELSGATTFTTAATPSWDRVTLDVAGTAWGAPRPLSGRGVIRAVHVEAVGGNLRIVLEGAGPLHVVSSQMLPPQDGKPPRLVLDVAAGRGAAPVPAAPPARAPQPGPPTPAAPAPILAAAPAPVADPLPVPVLSGSPTPPRIEPAVATVPALAAPALAAPAMAALPPGAAPAPMPSPMAAPMPAVLTPPAAAEAARPVKPAALRPPGKPEQPKLAARPLIVLDPGHGGVDPGAVAITGAYEKDITLAMARELKKQLEATGRYRVVLTRDTDMFVPLRERPGKARTLGADLFVSLHADSHETNEVRGLSVYTLSDTASDREAAMLASRENRADALAGMNLSSESDQVASILIDLAQRDTMNQSRRFAGTLVHEAERDVPMLPRPQRSAGFAVLTAPDIPSVLVELGYLSHPQDVRLLSSGAHQRRLAASMVRAIDGYFGRQQAASRS